MRKTKFLLVISILLLTTACNALSSPTPAPQPTTIIEVISTPTAQDIPLTEADVPRITVEEAKAAIESGAAVVIDVRGKDNYAASHIAGAINLPFQEFDPTRLALKKDQWIITYCT